MSFSKRFTFLNSKISSLLSLPIPFLILFIFVWYLMPWVSFRKFDKEMNTLCLANLISINKNKNPYSVFIGSSRERRGIEPQLIYGNSVTHSDPSLNLGMQSRSSIRAYTILENLYEAGINPKFVVFGLDTQALYKDSLEKVSQNLGNKRYKNEFIETYFLNKYLKNNLSNKELEKAKEQIKKVIQKDYFSSFNKKQFNNDFSSRLKTLKKITRDLRSPFSKKLVLKEANIYSESFSLPIKITSLIYAQRFLYVFNRSFEELYYLFTKNLIDIYKTSQTQGLWLGDICWRERFGYRGLLEEDSIDLKPLFLNKDYYLNNNDQIILKDSWEIHNNLRDKPQLIMKDISKYGIKRRSNKFSFGIPGLDYENAVLGDSNIAKFNFQFIGLMRELVERNNGKFILIRIPRIGDRYPSYEELLQIKSLYPEFIYPPKSFYKELNIKKHFSDPNHLSIKGRYLFSKWLNNELSSF